MDESRMQRLENLTFGKKNMDTSKALEFIKKNNESNEWPEGGDIFVERKPNDITKHVSISDALDAARCDTVFDLKPADVGEQLATLVEQNVDMFEQLEWLARRTAADDVRNGHVKLISQIMRCRDALWNDCFGWYPLVTETTPLYMLGCIAADIYNKNWSRPIIVANPDLKHVCQFFAQLCRDVGLDIVLIYTNIDNVPEDKMQIIKFKGAEGCTGVITERADLDSAVDAFIYSSVTAPWRLKQIYVQESVFEEFQSALKAKMREPTAASRHIVVGNKTFLMECLTLPESVATRAVSVPTRAYRTTKELLSLVDTPYLSVWAADSALSHEIALLSTAPTVWLNDYGSFDGPPRTALSVYHNSFTQQHNTDEILTLLKPWSEMQYIQRLNITISALKDSDSELAQRLLDLVQRLRSDDLLHITDYTICFGIQQRMRVLYSYCCYKEDVEQLFRIVKCLLNGNAVICGRHYAVFQELYAAGVPVVPRKSDDAGALVNVPLIMEQLKIVRTNYGTIFAN